MSELNEDILNYEIGDVDADDTDLTVADEDELLLSDDESISGRLAANEDEDDLLSEQTESKEQPQQSIDFDSQAIIEKDNALQSSDYKQKIDMEPRAKSPQPSHESPCISPENDLVSSTNKDDEEISLQPTQSQGICEQKDDEPSFAESEDRSESTANEDSEVSYSQSEQTDSKSESTFQSQDVASEETINTERASDDYDPDDSDDVRERRNPKTTNEREMPHQFEDNSKPKNFSQNYQRNRQTRPQMPRQNQNPYGPGPGGPDFNAPFMPQFRGARRPMLPNSQPEFMRGHTISMMRGPPNHMQRMPPGMQPHPSRMPVGPGHLGPPHQRLPRPPFQTGPGMFGNNPGMPPQGMIPRPRVPPNAHQMMPQRPPFGPYSQPNHPPNMRLPMNPSMPPHAHAQPMNPAIPSQSMPLPLINAPRKVLINPNFKGGVQAATNQLMLDTMKNSQIMENSREAELLRQQEAFINQNRMHIEKRRRSREHSPERDREYRERDRERERSYSPPRRRERDARKAYPSFRENRNRRADSRDREHPDAKKKRNDADGNNDKNDPKTEEDEETRAYRLEIEKQKALREKILRDKEMRRRKAAEELKKEEEKKVGDEPLQKFTPIVVTEKKIISLKKKAGDGPSDQASKPKGIALARKVQTAVVSEYTESGSQVKAVLHSSTVSKKIRIDDEEIDEDELLADSPPSTPAPIVDATTLKNRTNASKVGDIPTTMFTNRRIVMRNTVDTVVTNNEKTGLTAGKTNTGTGKGIFDRLDKKVISVNEAAKRKIQRIVINNSD